MINKNNGMESYLFFWKEEMNIISSLHNLQKNYYKHLFVIFNLTMYWLTIPNSPEHSHKLLTKKMVAICSIVKTRNGFSINSNIDVQLYVRNPTIRVQRTNWKLMNFVVPYISRWRAALTANYLSNRNR